MHTEWTGTLSKPYTIILAKEIALCSREIMISSNEQSMKSWKRKPS
jgi:hypothetical protein